MEGQTGGKPSLDIAASVEILKKDDPQTVSQLRECEAEIRSVRRKIASEAKKNFELEHALGEIDNNIKLLISNRMKVEEVLATAKALRRSKKDDENAPTIPKDKVLIYEKLFYLLQTRPTYFAQLARLVGTRETPLFVKTVVFDMYGDQYDTREERLLLILFQRAIYDEIQDTPNKGSLFRANTATTQMLSSYAKRGSGLAILKELLQKPLQTLTSKKDLNLEISPILVYNELITTYETEKGEISPLPRGVDDSVAAENEEVKQKIKERTKLLTEETEILLTRILEGGDKIPSGMRWICKQLGNMSKEKFPDADKYQIGSLIGGNIFLRFFCPAIITPDAINFVTTKPSKIMRKNLILIVKILQALSNGIPFGGKEKYMTVVNWYLDQHREHIQTYFEKLIQVDDLEDSLQVMVDKYLEHAKKCKITLSVNQIFLIHRLIETHLDKLAPLKKAESATDSEYKDDMNLRDYIRELGPAPAAVKRADDRELIIDIMERRENRTQSVATDALVDTESLKLEQLKSTLIEVLSKAEVQKDSSNDLVTFLEQQEQLFAEKGNSELSTRMSQVMQMIKFCKNEMRLKETDNATYNNYLAEVTEEVAHRNELKDRLERRLEIVRAALGTITDYYVYLEDRYKLYQTYLLNVRKGKSHTVDSADDSEADPIKKKSKKKNKLKLSHPEMVERKIIGWVREDLDPKTLKKLYYTFSEKAPGEFKVDVHLRKGVDIRIPTDGIGILKLEEVLAMQESGQRELRIGDMVELNVNLLVNLLNTTFIAVSAAHAVK